MIDSFELTALLPVHQSNLISQNRGHKAVLKCFIVLRQRFVLLAERKEVRGGITNIHGRMLFDDLPEIKKGGVDKKIASNNSQDDVKDSAKDELSSADNAHQSLLEEPGVSTSLHDKNAGVGADGKKVKSIVESLGSAGTTMAFVPAALRKRKPPATKQIPARRKNQLTKSGVSSTSGSGGGDHVNTIVIVNPAVEQQDENVDNLLETKPKNQIPIEEEYKEPPELTEAHASVRSADMYDPMTPNDYLAYKQRKQNESLQADIQREAQKTLEMQQKLRSHIESERQKALASGDVDRIIESRSSGTVGDGVGMGMGRGRGRGRGMSNLPAWLVKKQQEGKTGL